MRLYLAGPLFTQAERAWNLRLATALTEAGHDVFLPQVEIQSIEMLTWTSPSRDAPLLASPHAGGAWAADCG